MEVYQLAPFGNGIGTPNPVGFNVFNPSPSTPQYAPIPQANQPGGFPTNAPGTYQQQQQYLDPQMQGLSDPYGTIPQGNGDPVYQQSPMNQRYQMAPPTQRSQPQMAPMPSPTTQSYRGTNSPTAMRSQVPNYSNQLYGQRSNSRRSVQNTNFRNGTPKSQPGRILRTGALQRR